MNRGRHCIGICVVLVSLLTWATPAIAQEPGDFFAQELAAGLLAELAVMKIMDTVALAWPDVFSYLGPLPLLAVVAGPAAGVAIIGIIYGVEGNHVFSLLGSAVGCLAAFPLVFGSWESHPLVIALALGLPPLGATIGYNWRARMKDEPDESATLPSGLTLFAFIARF